MNYLMVGTSLYVWYSILDGKEKERLAKEDQEQIKGPINITGVRS
jgi:hypothetical protein